MPHWNVSSVLPSWTRTHPPGEGVSCFPQKHTRHVQSEALVFPSLAPEPPSLLSCFRTMIYSAIAERELEVKGVHPFPLPRETLHQHVLLIATASCILDLSCSLFPWPPSSLSLQSPHMGHGSVPQNSILFLPVVANAFS